MGKIIITPAGHRGFLKKLEKLKSVLRKEIPKMLKEAREQGDLSENAEYDVALAMQRDYEKRVQELEEILKNAEIVDDNDQSPGQLRFGTTVVIRLLDEDEIDEECQPSQPGTEYLRYRLSNPYIMDRLMRQTPHAIQKNCVFTQKKLFHYNFCRKLCLLYLEHGTR